jgi:hypothetical protein
MAITINGSGTVTGLSVGGLPDGTVDSGTLATDSVTAVKIPDTVESSLKSGRKNLIINGGFDVWQRGTSLTTGVGYTYGADRWSEYWGATWLKQTATINSEVVNTLKLTTTSANLYVYNHIEDKITKAKVAASFYNGKTVSFWYKTNISGDMGGYTGLASPVSTETWTYHSFAITAATSTDFFGRVGLVSGTSYIELANVQLELGSVATDFEHRSYGEELALCQRYYIQSGGGAYFGFFKAQGFAYTTTGAMLYLALPVTMRVAPTLTYAGSTIRIQDGVSGYLVTNITSSSDMSTSCMQLGITVASGLTIHRPYNIDAGSDTAGRIYLDAEL